MIRAFEAVTYPDCHSHSLLLISSQSRPLFVYFRLSHMKKFVYKLIKAWMVCLGLIRMEGADESTELWRHPLLLTFKRLLDLVRDPDVFDQTRAGDERGVERRSVHLWRGPPFVGSSLGCIGSE